MKFCLNTKIIEPDNKENIDYAIILLHGYGGDGKDISMLSLSWKRFYFIKQEEIIGVIFVYEKRTFSLVKNHIKTRYFYWNTLGPI